MIVSSPACVIVRPSVREDLARRKAVGEGSEEKNKRVVVRETRFVAKSHCLSQNGNGSH